MIRCCITDRAAIALRADADWIQIRAKNLSARDLLALVRIVLPRPVKVIVNTRMDVALAAGAAGLHLPAGSIAPRRYRAIVPENFLIGVSCHIVDEVRRAADEGADYVVYGPIFAPLSKPSDLPPRGLDGLSEAARAASIPVLALGGITRENAPSCIAAGASGIAGISFFE
jgi:thiamine-phosphate pyrophosphorylase